MNRAIRRRGLRRRNPRGVDWTPVIALAGVLWLVTSGILGGLPGGGGGHQWRLWVDYEGWILPGGTLHITWTIDHIGPAADLVVGLEFAPASFGCMVGLHNQPFTTMEANFAVAQDTAWTRYVATAEFPFPGGAGAYDSHFYIRNYNAAPLYQVWGCGNLTV